MNPNRTRRMMAAAVAVAKVVMSLRHSFTLVALLRAWPVNPNRTRGMMAAAVAVVVTTHYTARNAGNHAPETATQGS